MLSDEQSKRVYRNVLCNRLTWDMIEEGYVTDNQYFAVKDFMVRNPQDILIDCGAFTGDSVEQYIWKMDGVFRKIYAFEPDIRNFEAMRERLLRLRKEWNIREEMIELYPYGVGDSDAEMALSRNFDNNGLGSKITDSRDRKIGEADFIREVTLDSFFADRNEKVTFIKADIEGYEYRMLCGAKKLISNSRPRLAVCIYHNPTDLYSVPLLIRKINPDYRFAVRQHSYLLDETVLYAH